MITNTETYHIPVLLQESIDGLDIKPDGVYVDVTFGSSMTTGLPLSEAISGICGTG